MGVAGAIAATMLISAGLALAEAPSPSSPTHYLLDLTPQEVDFIGTMLMEQKVKDGMGLYLKVQAQVRAAQAPPSVTVTPTPAAPEADVPKN